MGQLIDGVWHDQALSSLATKGRFVRKAAGFRSWIDADPQAAFPAELGRYDLYVSLACPWAHRTLIYREIKGLAEHVSLSVVHPDMLEQGWTFAPGDGVVPDPNLGAEVLHQIYTHSQPDYTGRVTVPVLWDKVGKRIVSNESSEIIRMFGSAFDHLTGNRLDFYPEALRAEIDAVNERIYKRVNNGVYKVGFAGTQAVYEEEVALLFETLDWLEARLSQADTLVGGQITEADWRLLPTLLRFDAVYVGHFKCNMRRIADYPALSAYIERLLAYPGVARTVNMQHIKRHYYASHRNLNPSGIVPLGPDLPFARFLEPSTPPRLEAVA